MDQYICDSCSCELSKEENEAWLFAAQSGESDAPCMCHNCLMQLAESLLKRACNKTGKSKDDLMNGFYQQEVLTNRSKH